jgi:hypothetical protein
MEFVPWGTRGGPLVVASREKHRSMHPIPRQNVLAKEPESFVHAIPPLSALKIGLRASRAGQFYHFRVVTPMAAEEG